MKRTILLITIFIVSMTVALGLSLTASAETVTNEDGIEFTLNAEGTEYSVTDYVGTATEVVIPAIYEGLPVTSIGLDAFYLCEQLTAIKIPSSITDIGDSAFYDCHGLEKVTFDENSQLVSIGSSAFGCCSGLTSIEIPNSVTYIGNHAFYECSSLTSINIPANVTSIDSCVFLLCSGLTSIYIPENVTNISVDAFGDCCGLESITVSENNTVYHSNGNCLIETGVNTLVLGCKNSIIPTDGSVISIGNGAFGGCDELVNIKIPTEVTYIGVSAFFLCTKLETIIYDGSEEEWNAIIKDINWDYGLGSATFVGTYNVIFSKESEFDTGSETGTETDEIFDVDGQKHIYVGDKISDAPTFTGESFERDKYNEVVYVDLSDVGANDGITFTEEVNIEYLSVFMAYDDDKLYLGAEVGDNDFKGSESTTFVIRTINGKAEITLTADGELIDTKSVVTDKIVFSEENSEGGMTVWYALEIDRAMLMAVDTMSTDYADTFNLAVINNDDSGTVAYTLEDENGETIGHTFTLSADPNSDTITEDNGASSVTVTGQFVSHAADDVISVNLTWTIPTFTYTLRSEWDDVNYVDSPIEGSGVWSTTPADITVTNHSNQDISASFSFATTVADSGIVGKFTSDEAGESEIASVTLESAATNSAATESKVYFFVTDGELPETYIEGDTIGNITITIGALGNN